MSSESCESLDQRDPFRFLESQYQSQCQDRNSKSLNSSLNIKTQDLRVLIPVWISFSNYKKISKQIFPLLQSGYLQYIAKYSYKKMCFFLLQGILCCFLVIFWLLYSWHFWAIFYAKCVILLFKIHAQFSRSCSIIGTQQSLIYQLHQVQI